jgi:hypothetical protein
MNTNYRTHQLQSGQSLAVGGHGSATLFLAEGEALLQSPAEWLGDTVVQSPPRRVAAPAAVPCAEIRSITAIGAVKIQLEQAASPLAQLGSAWQRFRAALARLPRLAAQ